MLMFGAVLLVCAEVNFQFSGLLTPAFSGPLIGLYVLFPPICLFVFMALQTYVCVRLLKKPWALSLLLFITFNNNNNAINSISLFAFSKVRLWGSGLLMGFSSIWLYALSTDICEVCLGAVDGIFFSSLFLFLGMLGLRTYMRTAFMEYQIELQDDLPRYSIPSTPRKKNAVAQEEGYVKVTCIVVC